MGRPGKPQPHAAGARLRGAGGSKTKAPDQYDQYGRLLLKTHAGGRPRRDRADDEMLFDELVAALRVARAVDLHGDRGRPARFKAEKYLEERFKKAPLEIIRKAARHVIGK